MIGNHDTAFGRQVVEASDLGFHARQQEGGASRAGDEPAPALETGYQYGHEK